MNQRYGAHILGREYVYWQVYMYICTFMHTYTLMVENVIGIHTIVRTIS